MPRKSSALQYLKSKFRLKRRLSAGNGNASSACVKRSVRKRLPYNAFRAYAPSVYAERTVTAAFDTFKAAGAAGSIKQMPMSGNAVSCAYFRTAAASRAGSGVKIRLRLCGLRFGCDTMRILAGSP